MFQSEDTTTIPSMNSQEDKMMFMTMDEIQKIYDIDQQEIYNTSRPENSFLGRLRKFFN